MPPQGAGAQSPAGGRPLGPGKGERTIHALLDSGRPPFDRDSYKILAKLVSRRKPTR